MDQINRFVSQQRTLLVHLAILLVAIGDGAILLVAIGGWCFFPLVAVAEAVISSFSLIDWLAGIAGDCKMRISSLLLSKKAVPR